MKTTRKSNFSHIALMTFSLICFVYLNVIGVGDTSTFAISNIAEYQNVESSSFKEVRILSEAVSRIFEIITLK